MNLRLGPSMGAQESKSLAKNGDLSACSFVGKASKSNSVVDFANVLIQSSSEVEQETKKINEEDKEEGGVGNLVFSCK